MQTLLCSLAAIQTVKTEHAIYSSELFEPKHSI